MFVDRTLLPKCRQRQRVESSLCMSVTQSATFHTQAHGRPQAQEASAVTRYVIRQARQTNSVHRKCPMISNPCFPVFIIFNTVVTMPHHITFNTILLLLLNWIFCSVNEYLQASTNLPKVSKQTLTCMSYMYLLCQKMKYDSLKRLPCDNV